MKIDSENQIQKIRLGEESYVLVRENAYEKLLREVDALHSALEIQRNRSESAGNVVQVLLEASLTAEQAHDVLSASSFGQRLGLLRKFRGLDQKELAERAQISQTMVSKLENGKLQRPAFESVHKILYALGLPDIVTYPLLKMPALLSERKLEVHSSGRSSRP